MSNNTLRKVISFTISFVMMICMILAALSSWLMFEVLNYDAIRVKAGDDFYNLLYDEVCENTLLQTVSTGVPEDIILKPITRVLIEEKAHYQLESILTGKKFNINLDDIREQYIELFREYADETGDELDDAGARNLANYCVSIIKKSIELPFGSLISSYIAIMRKYLPVVIIVCAAISLLLAVFIYRISSPKINAARYYGISMGGVGIIGLFFSISALANKIYDKINFDSEAYSSAISGVGNYVINSLTILSAVVFLIGLVWLIVFSVHSGEEKDETS